MRTINKNLAKRLAAQLKEAELQGLTKVASNVSNMIKLSDVRNSDEEYTYSDDEFRSDIEKVLWTGVVRAADFYNCNLDAKDMQNVIESLATNLTNEVKLHGKVVHGVGAYEPAVLGEEDVVIEIEEE